MTTDEAPKSGAASLLMTGKLIQTSSGDFNVDDAALKDVPMKSKSGSRSLNNGTAEIDFLQDDWSEMTYGRRIALSLMKYKWYNPKAGDEDPSEEVNAKDAGLEAPVDSMTSEDDAFERGIKMKPSLEKAWAYFEHVALEYESFGLRRSPFCT